MSGVDAIIGYKRSSDEDFYGMLNCDENSSVEQIQAEYKVLALQFHPDKNSGDKEAEIKFQKLKEAKETLCDSERRANYDKWRNSGIAMSYRNWLGMKEHVGQVRRYTIAEKVDKKSMHWVTPKTKDRMLTENIHEAIGGESKSAVYDTSGGMKTLPGNQMTVIPNSAHRRASEGGAALYYGSRKPDWNKDSSDVANKFRNYEI